jgi:UDP-GlcNAc:undecaprenyl-phosphate/decaprenyl-phosphate GlcNAc-1-phosphate transferase
MAGLILVSAGIGLAWAAAAVWLGPRIGYVDAPGESPLRPHARPAVLLGGVGVFLGVHAGLLLGAGLEPALVAASALVLVLGLVDDRIGLAPRVRLVVWTVAGLVIAFGVTIEEPRGVAGRVLVVALVLLSVNAVNLLDGLDGLAGSSALVAAVGLALLAGQRGVDGAVPILTAAALAGFLVLNWHPARVFLGNSGAYVVGVLVSWGIVVTSPGGGSELVVAAGVLGVFAIDLVVTVLRRAAAGRPLFAGDRSHVYDQMRDLGWSVPGVVVAATAAQSAVVVAAVLVDRLVSPTAGAVVVAGLLATVVVVLIATGFARMAE